MIRIIVDTQSNQLFRGIEMEQEYDQRGGLCQVGAGHIVVTTNPIDQEYLEYWQELGFSLPTLLVAGPFDPRYTLSELIISKPALQKEILSLVKGRPARLEFFYIEESEKKLAEVLGIPPYCNFKVSIPLSRKVAFKQVCQQISLPTPSWKICHTKKALLEKGRSFLDKGKRVLIKTNTGTGGLACGGMEKAESIRELEETVSSIDLEKGPFVIEELIEEKMADVAIHWEITPDRHLHIIGLFNQFSTNFSYQGSSFPVQIPFPLQELIKKQLKEKLFPYLLERKALGYFCCDIVIDKEGNPYWVDFNPRKGAILYVYDMTRRLSNIRFGGKKVYFWHEHCKFPGKEKNKTSFRFIKTLLSDFLTPHPPFVVITNPGIIRFGYVDITDISLNSIEVFLKL